MLAGAVGKVRKRATKSASKDRWPVGPVVEELVRRSEELGLSPAEIGALVGNQQRTSGREKSTDAQSFYDVRDGNKRLWVNDADRWAAKVGGTVQIRYESDTWADLEAAIGSLPAGFVRLKQHLFAIVRDERATSAVAQRPKARAAGTSK